jgi:hypothetical protein
MPALLTTSVASPRRAGGGDVFGFVTSRRIGSTPGQRHARGIARAGVDLARAARDERLREGQADAAVRRR